MALSITRTNCQKLIEAQLCGLPCGWKSAIASAICFAVTSSQGQSGYSGFSGASGADGTSASGFSGIGFSGQSGFSGYSGFSGDNPGSSGFSGGSGYSGFSGANPGASGYSGYSGANPGVSGYSGYSGYSGDNPGSSGYSGFSGAGGASGFSGTATVMTADNALIMSTPTNVQFGGPTPPGAPLLHNTYVDMAGFITTFTGAVNAAGAFQVLNTDSIHNIAAIYGQATSSAAGTGVYGNGTNVGVLGNTLTGSGLYGIATSGVGVTTSVTTGLSANLQTSHTSLNTITDHSQFVRFATGGTAANGIGLSINLTVQDTGGSAFLTNRLRSKWVDATHATRTSQFEISGIGGASENTIASFYGTGVVGIGISSSYTASRLNVVDDNLAGGALKMVNLTSTSTNNSILLNVSATGSMAGIVSNTAAQVAITGQAVDATAISGTSVNAFGVSGSSTNSYAGTYTVNPASTNIVVPIALYQRGTTGTAANNIGGSIQIAVNCVTNGGRVGTELVTKWLDATDATRTSEFSITGVDSSATKTLLQISGPGIFTITQGLQNFADDTAAAVGLIPVNGLYRTASVVKIRVT